jgi:endo-1,4-beta-D-glucanase Y/predicted membrane-bound dolichyl-phosphate-mannose-protein mannosyltransferase
MGENVAHQRTSDAGIITIIGNMSKSTITYFIFGILLGISTLAHGYNMFQYPYYENDEGTYLSQAWSLATTGNLTPYTYWYDHAPLGWMFMALWVKVVGIFTFGVSVNSGRVFMLILHVLSSGFLFYIARKISKSLLPAVIAVLIFSLSPLGIHFQRRVLLDNIMVFWVFGSLALLLLDRLKLTHIALSALCFGIAVLTKENAIFFLPVFLYVVATRVSLHQRVMAVIQWVVIVSFIISLYFLYAFLKKELFPVGWFGDTTPHVSLLGTLKDQFSRGEPHPFWDSRGDFYVNFLQWIKKDSFTITAGAGATVIAAVLSVWVPQFRIPALLSIFMWLFLMRGKLVIDFYVVPLISMLALTIGVVTEWLLREVFRRKVYPFFATASVIAMVFFLGASGVDHFTRDETGNQVKALEWIKKNVPEQSHIIIDNALYIDLRAPRYKGDRVYPNADYVWKVEKDPMILNNKFRGTWQSVDYITVSHEVLKKIREYEFPLTKAALDNASETASYRTGSISYVEIPKYISTNGDWMDIYKVKSQDNLLIDRSWQYYKEHFLVSYGQVVDPASKVTTSEGQSYAMLRAVWLNDKVTFDGVWKWTRDHLQFRGTDKLFSWKWEGDKVADSETASDADNDIALALLFAYAQWGEEAYLAHAKEIIADIWEYEVVDVNGTLLQLSGTHKGDGDYYRINPSYCSPASFRIFSRVDDHDWDKLADDCYTLIDRLVRLPRATAQLPPNWVEVNKTTGALRAASETPDDNRYGFDAFRLFWRISLDHTWFSSLAAEKYLSRLAPFFADEWKNGGIRAIYSLDGTPTVSYTALSVATGALSALDKGSPDTARAVYDELFVKQFNFDEGYWGDKTNYYDQNWAWFAVAQHTGRLPNLWRTR